MGIPNIKPINLIDLNEQTYTALRELILRGELKPGEKVMVDETARSLGVSRTPVMDALKRLASDGMVEIVPRRGTFVTSLNAGDIQELFQTRLMFETFAAEHILTSDKVDHFLERISKSLTDMQHSIVNDDYGDYETFIENDRKFHVGLIEMVGNERLIQMYSNLNVHIQIARAHYMRRVQDARQAQTEHLGIVQAFQERDLSGARQRVANHINHVCDLILNLLKDAGETTLWYPE